MRAHRREDDVALFGDGAGLGDLGREAGNTADLVLGHDRAAREAPDPAVNHAHAEAGGAASRGFISPAKAGVSAAEIAAAATPAAAATAAASPAPAERVGEVAVPAVRVHARVGASREPDIGVRASGQLRLGKRHVSESLEPRLEHLALRRLRDQIADEIAGGDGGARERHGLDEVSTMHWWPLITCCVPRAGCSRAFRATCYVLRATCSTCYVRTCQVLRATCFVPPHVARTGTLAHRTSHVARRTSHVARRTKST